MDFDYPSVEDVLRLHAITLERGRGSPGIRDQGLLESAVAQPQMSFGGQDLYPAAADKAAALCFSLVANHPFVDGNKRVGHAAMEAFLILNGYELDAPVDEQEQLILGVAAGSISREQLAEWIETHLVRSE